MDLHVPWISSIFGGYYPKFVHIICIGHITSYLARNVRPILHIYSSSVSDWCNTTYIIWCISLPFQSIVWRSTGNPCCCINLIRSEKSVFISAPRFGFGPGLRMFSPFFRLFSRSCNVWRGIPNYQYTAATFSPSSIFFKAASGCSLPWFFLFVDATLKWAINCSISRTIQ